MKKLLAVVLVVFMLLSALTSCTAIESVTDDLFDGIKDALSKEKSTYSDGLLFELSSDAAYYILSGIGECTDTEINIPSTFNEMPMKEIGNGAFSNCSFIKSVIIPNSVTGIGEKAFNNCTALVDITIPDSVVSIGAAAFYNCESLENVYITDIEKWCNINFADGLDNIYEVIIDGNAPNFITNPLFYAGNLYLNGNLVTELEIPNSVTEINPYAFVGCDSIISVTIPNSVTSIGDWAFYGCTRLTSVTIPNSVTSIGDMAFCVCTGLTSVTIPNSVTSIGDMAFYYCTGLTNVTIGSGVTSIGSSAFEHCTGLTSVTIPNNVTSISSSAFSYCTGLTSVTIPKSVTQIWYAFYGCTALESVIFENPTIWCVAHVGSIEDITPDNITPDNITPISAVDIADPSKAAKYLSDTYDDFIWVSIIHNND